MENNDGVQDPNLEEEPQPNEEDGSDDESGKELDDAKEYGENQKIRAEKAEQKIKKAEQKLKEALEGKKSETETPKKEEVKEEKSNESDLQDKLNSLTLKTEGITHDDDTKVVVDEANRLKLDVEEVMKMEHIQAKLKANKDKRDVANAMPDSKGKSGGDFEGDVAHWIDKKNDDGTYQTPDDLELAEKVIDARVKQQKTAQQFEPIRL